MSKINLEKPRKQITYLVITHDDEQRKKVLDSGFALIYDWNRHMFEIPHDFKKRFEEKTGIKVPDNMDHSSCPLPITKNDIYNINQTNWGNLINAS